MNDDPLQPEGGAPAARGGTQPEMPAGADEHEVIDATERADRPIFAHPQWMVGIVLIFAVFFLLAGIANPIWLLIGSPFILVLALWVWVRFFTGS